MSYNKNAELIKRLNLFEKTICNEADDALAAMQAENERLWKEREEPHEKIALYVSECNRLENERDELRDKLAALEGQEAVAEVVHIKDSGFAEIDWLWPIQVKPQLNAKLYLAAGAAQPSAAVPEEWELVPAELSGYHNRLAAAPQPPAPSAKPLPTMQDALDAGDAIIMTEQKSMLSEVRKALDALLKARPMLASFDYGFGCASLGNLRAELGNYKEQGSPIAKPLPLTEWMPIETAPKDANFLILAVPGRSFFGSFVNIPFQEYRDENGVYLNQQDPQKYWMDAEDGEEVDPTHWMPLPEAPITQEKQA